MAGYRRVDYVKLAEEASRKYDAELRAEGRTGSPPWRGYNDDKPFCCAHCGAHFDTSVGCARHQVYGCDGNTTPQRTQQSTQQARKCREAKSGT